MLLKFLRKKKTMKRIMWALAIIIIPAFVIWGSGSSTRDRDRKGHGYAGKIFNKKISFEEYRDMWNVTRDTLVRTFSGTNIPPELIDQMAWNRIILLELAKRENIAVKNDELLEEIFSFPVFRRDGVFDKKLYKSMLGDSAKAFEERVRDDIRVTKLREKITDYVSVPDEEVKEEYKKRNEKIKASYISVPFGNFEKYVRHTPPDLFMFYEKNKENFRKPEEINVRYIEIQEEGLAYRVLDDVTNKNNLDKVAPSAGLETKETGFFNTEQEIPGIGWSFQFSRKAFELKKDEISNTLIKANDNFYIIQLKEKKESYIPGFVDVMDSVKDSYIKAQSIVLAEKEAKKLHLWLKYNKKTLKDLEQAPTQTDLITRSDYIPTLGPAQEFVEVALSLKDGEISHPVKMSGSWAILKRDEYEGIDEEKFSEEKEQLKENLLTQKKEEAFNNWFKSLKKEANFVSYTGELP